MEKKERDLKEKVKRDLERERQKHRKEQQNLKVSFPTHVPMFTTLHSFIPVLFSCPLTPYPKKHFAF